MSEPLADGPHWSREPLIPVRRARLVQWLAERDELGDHERQSFRRLAREISARFHEEFRDRLEKLKEAFAPFDLDDDLRSLETWDDQQREVLQETLVSELDHLLQCANYRQLDPREVEEAVDTASDWGVRLHVDFSLFEYLAVYARGDVLGTRERRNWRRWFRKERVGVPLYLRLVVVFRLHRLPQSEEQFDVGAVHLKLFKNVPKLDVDMLLPGTRVRMSLWDQGKILFPTVSGAAITLTKLFKGALWAALAGTFWGLVALAGILAGGVGYVVRSFLGYQRTRDRYQLNLTRSRYYQQLDHGAGVIYRILDEAEEQETRETLVAYYLLWKRATEHGWTKWELKVAAERFLQEMLGIPIDFEVDDALRNALRFGLVEQRPGDRFAVSSDVTRRC